MFSLKQHAINLPPTTNLRNIFCMFFCSEIPLYAHNGVKWTNGEEGRQKKLTQEDLPKFDSLDGHTQSQLLALIEQGAYQRMPRECREVRQKYCKLI